MDMDDDNSPDDHGIFTAMSSAHHQGHEDSNDGQEAIVTDVDGNVVIGHLPTSTTPTAVLAANEDGDGGRGSDSEKVLTELESPKSAGKQIQHDNRLTFRMVGMDDNGAATADDEDDDVHGIEVEMIGGDGDGDGHEIIVEEVEEHDVQEFEVETTTAEASTTTSSSGAATGDPMGAHLARRQLQKLTGAMKVRAKKSLDKTESSSNSNSNSNSTASSNGQPSEANTSSAKVLNVEIIKAPGSSLGAGSQLIKSMQHRLSQKMDQVFVTPNKPIPKVDIAGTIEIPKDLIIGGHVDGDDDVDGHVNDDDMIENASFVISNEPVILDDGLPDADLLAILEGNDDDAAIAVVSPSKSGGGGGAIQVVGVETTTAIKSPTNNAVVLDKDAEMELALQQIMSLPQKRKGRPCKPRVLSVSPAVAPPKNKSKDLVNSLVQDWSGSDSDSDSPPKQAPKKTKAAVVGKVAEALPVPATFKRSRIIKKKVIWDPDAPETAISYASLVQPHAAATNASKKSAAAAAAPSPPVGKGAPRILNKIPASQLDSKTRSPPLQAKRRPVTTPPSPSALQQRKRKISEVDRLRDEGAINMLNALKQEALDIDAQDDDDDEHDDDGEDHNRSTTPSSSARSQKSVGETSQRAVRSKRPHTPAGSVAASSGNAAAAAADVQAVATVAATKKEPGSKRPKKGAAATATSDSNSWDYIYSHRDDESLIIRRRSNSSYSSSASTNRLSIEAPAAAAASSTSAANSATKSNKASRVKDNTATAAAGSPTSFEFAKPTARKSAATNADANADSTTILMDIRSKSAPATSSVAAETRRSKRGGAANATSADDNAAATTAAAAASEQTSLNAKERKILAKLNSSGVVTTVIKWEKSAAPAAADESVKGAQLDYQEIELKRRDGGAVGHIVLQPFSGKLENVYTTQMMREVCKALNVLSADTACKIVLISSATATFCNGLDYTPLLQSSSDKRRTAAADLATDVSQFIESLASFPKTLVAAVHGRCVGIGVTVLPLFDVVLAKDTATFETPFARSGQLPEACSVLQLSTKVSHNAKTDLLLLAETLKADAAQRHNLVTKVLPANGFEADVHRRVTALSALSAQALDAMKAVAQSAELTSLPIRIADEQKMLQQHWTSAEWQDSFKRYLSTNKW